MQRAVVNDQDWSRPHEKRDFTLAFVTGAGPANSHYNYMQNLRNMWKRKEKGNLRVIIYSINGVFI